MDKRRVSIAAIGIVVAIACWLVDALTKQAFFIDPLPVQPFSFFSGLLSQINHFNYGITFDLPIPQFAIIVVTVLVLFVIAWQWFLSIRSNKLPFVVALSILAGGAFGNLVDRLRFGYVRDWILAFHRSAFNLADLMIAIGFITWLWLIERESKKRISTK